MSSTRVDPHTCFQGNPDCQACERNRSDLKDGWDELQARLAEDEQFAQHLYETLYDRLEDYE